MLRTIVKQECYTDVAVTDLTMESLKHQEMARRFTPHITTVAIAHDSEIKAILNIGILRIFDYPDN